MAFGERILTLIPTTPGFVCALACALSTTFALSPAFFKYP